MKQWILIPAILLSAGLALAADNLEIRQEFIPLKTVAPNRYLNGSGAGGILYTAPAKPSKTVVIFIHPEGESYRDWRVLPLVKEGFATFGMAARYSKENQHLIMEEVVLDIAEAIRTLKARGFTHVILHGHSGGGSTVAFYQEQATLQPPNRVKSTPAGDPPDLNKFDLPKADGLILSAAHLGRGWATARKLDPAVLDENDPLATDYSLDMYNPENGYRPPPAESHYTDEFKSRFAAAQQMRMNRLIGIARSMIDERKTYQRLLDSADYKNLPVQEQLKIQRGAIVQRYMTIYRNWSNMKYTDLDIDPSDRVPGGGMVTERDLASPDAVTRTDLKNYYAWYHPRVITPEALLSAESTASNVYSPRTMRSVDVPVLVIIGTADPTARLEESKLAYERCGSKEKQFVTIVGANHAYRPEGPKAGKGDQREQAVRALTVYLNKYFSK
jgi:alpha-beta hydrolase superfamily lysophospholipase